MKAVMYICFEPDKLTAFYKRFRIAIDQTADSTRQGTAMSIAVILFVLTIIIISFIFGGMAIKWQNDFKLKREELRAEGRGSSLGTSELRGLIQEAMMDVVVPLEERLDRIEGHLRQLPERATGTVARETVETPESNTN